MNVTAATAPGSCPLILRWAEASIGRPSLDDTQNRVKFRAGLAQATRVEPSSTYIISV